MGKHSHSKGMSPDQISKYAGTETAKPKAEVKEKEQEEQNSARKEKESKTEQELSPEEQKIQTEIVELVKFMSKSDLKIKEAACEGKRIAYFRGSDFYSFVKEKADHIHKILPNFLSDIKLSDENGPEKFLQLLIDNQVLLTLERSKEEEKKYKYPKYLTWSRSRTASDKGFYFCAVNVESKSRGFMMYLILLGVFALCLFQVWPIQLKIATFYISVVSLYAIIGLILVRYALYFPIRVLGIEFWIFPNLFEDVSVIDSFKPFLSVKRAKDGTAMYLIRLVGAVVLGFAIYIVVKQPEILKGFSDVGVESFDDIIEWGKEKLDPNQTFVSIRGSSRIKNLETILNETEGIDEDDHDKPSPSSTDEAKDSDQNSKKDEEEEEEADKQVDDYDDIELNRDSA